MISAVFTGQIPLNHILKCYTGPSKRATRSSRQKEVEVEDDGSSGNPFSSPAPRLRPHIKKLVEQVSQD